MTVAIRTPDNTPEEYKKKQDFSIMEQAIIQGDLSKLTNEERIFYYSKVCESIGLNPYTKPFDYISMNGKLTLYAKKDATEQLRKLNGISIEKLEDKVVDDLYIVKATARDKNGRIDTSTGAVVIGHLKGEAKANAIMKAETKAKRRVTLSISGMGWCDESEIETIPYAKPVDVNHETGEISPKITDEQHNYLIELIKQSDDTCISNMCKWLKDTHQVETYKEIPPDVYPIVISALNKNINLKKRNQAA